MSEGDLDPAVTDIVTDIGKLLGLLHQDSGDLNKEWFSDPLTNLKDIPKRLTDLLELINTILGPAESPLKNGPSILTEAQWYPIRNPLRGNDPTSFCVVTPKSAPGITNGVIGAGVLTPFGYQNLSLTAYGFLPLFELSTTADPSFVLTRDGTKIGLQVNSSSEFSGTTSEKKKFTFTAIDLQAEVILSNPPLAQSLKLTFVDLCIDEKPAPPGKSTYTSLAAVVQNIPEIFQWFAAVILQGTYWLNTYVGQSSFTVGEILTLAKVLKVNTDTESYELDIDYLKTTTPKQFAEDFFFALMSSLADSKDPLIPVPGGGIYIVEEDDLKTIGLKHYGVRLVITDLAIAGSKEDKPARTGGDTPVDGKATPEILLQIGKWIGEEDDANSWVARSLSNTTAKPQPKPGISVFLLSRDDKDAVQFDPYYDFISLGLDIKGGDQQPLFNIDGYVLRGGELRTYLTEKDSTFRFGVAASLDGLGVPLGPGFGDAEKGSESNPVAQSLLESGSKSPGEDKDKSGKDAVNPSFGFSVGYVETGKVVAQLYDKDGTPAQVVMIPIQRAVGPLQCEKLGIGWVDVADSRNDKLSLLFDGGVKLGTLNVDLVDLSISIPITDPGNFSKYELDLNGIGVEFKAGDVELSAALVKLPKIEARPYVEYDGEALLKAGTLSLAAVGSYAYVPGKKATDPGFASLFIFAVADDDFGDPTETGAFFITGIAAGFGYNRGLTLPAQDAVPDFPLVAGASDPSALGGNPPAPAEALEKLNQFVPPEQGEYWLAAGIRFTSYDLINSTALVVVEFGNELEIALLGLSWISLPPPPAPGAQAPDQKFAYGELGMEIVILPSEGVVSATAILTSNSFVLDPGCKLTGGFAFYVWFGSNPHAGEFVLTLGGYHPNFMPPSYFPAVPRLGFNWPVSNEVTIDGEAYFALTPSAVMAGGGLHVLFQHGDLNAWFKADMNVLIEWAPFYYQAQIAVSIGVSARLDLWLLTITLKLELSADVYIKGPQLSGVAHINFYIVSVTVRFGAVDVHEPSPLHWINDDGTGFAQTLLPHKTAKSTSRRDSGVAGAAAGFLPAAAAGLVGSVAPSGIYTITVNDGLLQNFINAKGETIWIVRGNHFVFSAVTTFPCTLVNTSKKVGAKSSYKPGDCPNPDPYNSICVRPMRATLNSSVLTIDLPDGFDADVASSAVPAAKWGKPLPKDADPEYNNQLSSRLLGLKNIRPKIPVLTPTGASSLDIHVQTAFTYEVVDSEAPFHPYHLPLNSGASPLGAVPQVDANVRGVIHSTLMSKPVATVRNSILGLLQQYGVDPVTNGDLTQFAADPGAYLNGNPWLVGSAREMVAKHNL